MTLQGEFSFGEFLRRRVRRIMPALAVMLTGVLLVSGVFSPQISWTQTVRTGLFASWGLANAFLFRFRPDGYFVKSEHSNALLHTWSLSLEEQTYLLVALVVGLVAAREDFRKRITRRSILVCITALSLVTFGLCVIASVRGVNISSRLVTRLLGTDSLDSRFAFYVPFSRLWQFLTGAAVYLSISRQGDFRLSPWLRICGAVVLGISTFVAQDVAYPGFWSLSPTLATAAILAGPATSMSIPGRLGSLLEILGDRSYSWYLWHWPIIQFVAPFTDSRAVLAVAASASLFVAELSFRFVESPFRINEKWRINRRSIVLMIACLAAPTIAFLLARNPEKSFANHVDVRMRCVYGEIERLSLDGPCVVKLPSGLPLGVAALVGDSHASHLSEAFIEASHALSLDAMLATHANQPFLIFREDTDGGSSRYTEEIVRHVISSRVSLVVVAQSEYQIGDDEGRSWMEGMRNVLEELKAAKIRVVVVAQSLNAGADPVECSMFQTRISMCPADLSFETAARLNNRWRVEFESRLAEQFRGVVLYDSAKYLCPEAVCALRRNGRWWWRDNGHISVYASKELTESLESAMQAALRE